MTCQEFWNSLPQPPLELEQEGHLGGCPACQAAFDRERALIAGLRSVAAGWSDLGAPARVENRLVAAFRGHSGLALGSSRRPWIPAVTWLGAAAAIAAVALALGSSKPPRPAHRNTIEWAMAQAPADATAGEDQPYSDGDFIPLPNAARIGPNEDVNLVRVEVPRSTMLSLGYEVSPDRISEPVEAEVVLGADGLARAVRFLDE